MLGIKAIGDFNKAVAWAEAAQKQEPYSISQGLNATAYDIQQGFNKGTISAFNKPVSFTQKAFKYKKSNKRDLKTFIFAVDKEGADRARYLRFGIGGGSRPQKGFERYFEKGVPNDGSIPSGSFFMPGPNVKLNASGNVTRATLKRITKGLAGSKRGGFFIGTPRNNNMPPGIYRRSREQLFPYFIATTDKPDYTGRFNIQGIGDKIVERRFLKHTQQFLDTNIKNQLKGK
tara:strand:- start:100 stop:792 length:693 start_codon:yes stop_codon:yes gene_type:complete